MSSEIQLSARVPIEKSGNRFDVVAAEMFPDYSRSRIKKWIKEGDLALNGHTAKPNFTLSGGEMLTLNARTESEGAWLVEDISLDVVHEDDTIIVLNKPAGLVVHPAAGNWQGTLLNGLLFRYPELGDIPRAGIVHRLDKETSGLMVVARTLKAQHHLVSQLQDKSVNRCYRALVRGVCPSSGVIDAAIGRHPTARTKMAVVKSGGKEARTHYTRVEAFDGFSLVELQLETGRTHQIRVHMAHIGFPLVGDPVYGQSFSPQTLKNSLPLSMVAEFSRQALHAIKLGLIHPDTGEQCAWTSPLAGDFEGLLGSVREYF